MKTAAIVLVSTLSMAPLVRAESPHSSDLLRSNRRAGAAAMSRAHREILHQARFLARIAQGLGAEDADRYLVRDGQRVIESI